MAAGPGQPEGQARLGVGRVGHLLADTVGAATAGRLVKIVGSDGEVADGGAALVLRLTELAGPGGLSLCRRSRREVPSACSRRRRSSARSCASSTPLR